MNTLTTYAQNREDLYLYGLIGNIDKGFYVDVGANHEKLHSVTRLFYERGWSGINVEPNPLLYKEFPKKRRRDINLQIGISDRNGTMSLRVYPNQDGLSTLAEDIKLNHLSSGYEYEDFKIKVRTLKHIFKAHNVRK